MIRNATQEDLAYVLANMRPEDVREIWKATGKSCYEALADLEKLPYVALVIWNDVPVCVFGATLDPDGESATMFRFATPEWPTVVREAIKFGRRQFVDKMREAGVKRLVATTLSDSDTDWLKLFGAQRTGGRVDDSGTHFHTFELDLAA